MLRSVTRYLIRLVLGPAAHAGRQELDADAKLALAPRALEDELQKPVREVLKQPRRVGHLVVHDGGRADAPGQSSGPLGTPVPVFGGGALKARE